MQGSTRVAPALMLAEPLPTARENLEPFAGNGELKFMTFSSPELSLHRLEDRALFRLQRLIGKSAERLQSRNRHDVEAC